MKRLSLAVLLVALLASFSFAGVQDFGAYTIDVPAGWTAQADDETVSIIKNDNTAAVSITYDETGGAALGDLAKEYAKALNGRDLQQDGDYYIFAMTNANGVDSVAYLFGDDVHYALIVATGIENAEDDIIRMIGSLEDN